MATNSPLIFIIYISRAAIHFEEQQIAELALKSAEKNKTVDATGLLLKAGNHFLQILEGPPENIRPLLAKIKRDPRHTNVRVLFEESITNRRFGQWGMNYLPLDGSFNIGDGDIFDLKKSIERCMVSSQDIAAIVDFIKILPKWLAERKVYT